MRLLHGPGGLVDVGRATRTIPAPPWAALVARDRGCRFPGCDRPVEWCEAHHLVPWERGGRPDRDNLALLRALHHHLVHTSEWRAKRRPDGHFIVTRPDGTASNPRPLPHLLR